MPKEVIDSILDENGRDLEALKASNEALKDRLKTAEDGLKAFEGVDVSQLQGEINKLKGDLAKKDSDWQEKLDGMAQTPIPKISSRICPPLKQHAQIDNTEKNFSCICAKGME